MAEPADRANDIVIVRSLRGVGPEEVLRYWTEPALLTRWWPRAARIEPEPGGVVHLAWPDQGWHLRGRVLEHQAGARLRFTWAWDHTPDEPEREVRVDVEPERDGTHLRVTHGRYGTSASEAASRASATEGWAHFLTRLEHVLIDGRGDDA